MLADDVNEREGNNRDNNDTLHNFPSAPFKKSLLALLLGIAYRRRHRKRTRNLKLILKFCMLYRNLCRISMGSSPFLSATLNRCVSLPILLLCFLLFAAANAERDFNVNDSQVSAERGEQRRLQNECHIVVVAVAGEQLQKQQQQQQWEQLQPVICLLILIDDD